MIRNCTFHTSLSFEFKTNRLPHETFHPFIYFLYFWYHLEFYTRYKVGKNQKIHRWTVLALHLTDMVNKNKTRECARAVLWDTALKFSRQSSAMTSPDRLEPHAHQNSYLILHSLLKYAKIEQANKRKILLVGLRKNLLACRSEKTWGYMHGVLRLRGKALAPWSTNTLLSSVSIFLSALK